MADLLTHVAAANLCAKAVKDDRARALILVGTCVPDVAYKTLIYATGSSTWSAEPTHSPVPLAALCFGLALLFEESMRSKAFWALFSGGCLHLAIDLGKDYMGQGVIVWAFPFSMDRIELAWYSPEDTLYMMGGAAVVLVLTEFFYRRFRRRVA